MSQHSLSQHSLNDLAALLVMLEPDDASGRRKLRSALAAAATDSSLPENARIALQDALKRWTGVARGQREAALAEVRMFVEAAQRNVELRDRLAVALDFDLDEPTANTGADRVRETPLNDDIGALLPADADVSLLADFITESRELLENAEAALLLLETEPDNDEAVNTVFRAFHTIKGTSGFLGLTIVMDFAHHAETLLSRVRDREIRCTGGYAGLALRSADMLGEMLHQVKVQIDGAPPASLDGLRELTAILTNPEAHGISEVERRAAWSARSAIAAEHGADNPSAADTRAPRAGTGVGAPAGGPPPTSIGSAGDASLRVRTERLDRLIEMVGELVIAHSMIAQDPIVKSGGHHDFTRKVSHAEKIVRELQDLSMSMRMVPLRGQFQKLNRLVRDLATKNGKLVVLQADGEETEIDRNMVDYLSDPLVHMVRNAVDHGIESPDERERAGKPRVGNVQVRASHSGGNVIVELHDDGRGLHREKIVRKAMEKGLIESGEGLSDSEVFELIFAPGFSTAEQLTDVSGRGVGMDVVRRNIEKLRGRIEIQSASGKGTTFIVRLPLTLAITDGMLVRVGAERYIVPTINIHLSFRPSRAVLSTVAGRGEIVMLRDEVMPLVRMHRVFGVTGAQEDPTQALLMVVGDGAQRTALLVDELLGQQQVVAKSLGDGLGRIPAISGGAILGDGKVGLILDVNELLSVARTGDGQPSLSLARAVA